MASPISPLRAVARCSAALAALTAVSCVSMVGQRITLHHDVADDRLDLLICSDGLSVDEQRGFREPVDFDARIAEFVADGGALLILSPTGTIELEDGDGDAGGDDDVTEATRRARRAWARAVEVEQLGIFTDLDGRIGTAQRVSFRGVDALLERIDAAIDAELLRIRDRGDRVRGDDDGEGSRSEFLPGAPATRSLWYAAAEDPEHRWLALDGHALVGAFPADPREFEQFAPDVLGALHAALGAPTDPPDAVGEPTPPVSDPDHEAKAPWTFRIARTADRVDVVVQIGVRERPSTLRWYSASRAARYAQLPDDGENARFRAAVAAAGLGDWHARLVDGAPPAWFPAEERVRALLVRARENADFGDEAARRLAGIARTWNAAGRTPRAPEDGDLDAWEAWYRAVVEL